MNPLILGLRHECWACVSMLVPDALDDDYSRKLLQYFMRDCGEGRKFFHASVKFSKERSLCYVDSTSNPHCRITTTYVPWSEFLFFPSGRRFLSESRLMLHTVNTRNPAGDIYIYSKLSFPSGIDSNLNPQDQVMEGNMDAVQQLVDYKIPPSSQVSNLSNKKNAPEGCLGYTYMYISIYAYIYIYIWG